MNFEARDGLKIEYDVYEVENPKYIMQIVHGAVSYRKRYKHFAEFLNTQGVTVYVADVRGHGHSFHNKAGFFSPDKNGWNLIMDDVMKLGSIIHENHPGKSCYLFGHSMGSFIVRNLAMYLEDEYQGIVISGTGNGSAAKLYLAIKVARLMGRIKGSDYSSKFLHGLLFNDMEKQVKKLGHSSFITRDLEILKEFRAIPECDFLVTPDFIEQMAFGMLNIMDFKAYLINPKIPFLFIQGEDDPVGGKKADLAIEVVKNYEDNGNPIEFKLYPGGLHEMLNEINRDEVYADIVNWLEKQEN